MTIFLTLLAKLFPLYLIVFLGWIAGRYLEVKKESIASLLIYIIAPVVVFNGVITTELNFSTLSLPVLFFTLACLLCLLFYFIGTFIWEGSEKNILAFTSGVGNVGYFGLPVVLSLFGEKFLGVAVLSVLGFILYENSLGFFVVAKGRYTRNEALKKVLTLPALYAFFVGLIVNLSHVQLGTVVFDIIGSFRGAYTVLGMMLVGLGLSQVTRMSFDPVFSGIAFLAKFVAWPLVVGTIVFFDIHFFHVYSTELYKIMLVMSIVPLASNTIAFATKLGTHPEKAAVTVLLSTLFALVYIPLFVSLIFCLF
jgi:hypothetical protein